MAKNNIYAKNAKISTAKFRQLLKLFTVDLNATQIAEIMKLNRNTVNRYLKAIRESIAKYCETESPFTGIVEVDESYFGAKRVRGKRGRGALGKTKVFGIFKRNGSVYTEIVPDCSAKTLLKAIRGRVSLDSIVHSDGWRGYNGLVDVANSQSASCLLVSSPSVAMAMPSIIGSITIMTSLQTRTPPSMASKASGVSPRAVLPSLKGFLNPLSIYT